ncbi:L-2-amino-thiazoline-4-carboxylic acid hydrolase [Ihubacter sp. mB4P-1]|uniref:L-2-amino-thiazoline-4-carboxylic acid hydrolase n=1 Tax=Ihubacter sp. mB4P-1 TaxID=3242370 RepID=UPI0013797FD1
MTRIEALKNQNCQDVWPKLYYYIAKELLETNGLNGEKALRSGIRKYGEHRGSALRKEHIQNGYPINMYSLFMAYDLPDDPRFRRRSIKLTKNERLSETLVCPIADLWITYGAKDLGRIYCEEYHHAMFSAYAPGSQTNLGQTLTQDGDNHCRFSVYYRQANGGNLYGDEEADFKEFQEMPYREGIEMIVVRLLNNLYLGMRDELNVEKASNIIHNSLKQLALDTAQQYLAFAESIDEKVTSQWLASEFPLQLDKDAPYGYWLEFEDQTPWNLFKSVFEPSFKNCIYKTTK